MADSGTQAPVGRVGQYEDLVQIGAGGMGVVFRARDTKLNRTVALKFLPHSVGEDPVRKNRFLQEARAAAALDHTNVGAVYTIEEAEGRLFIVMPYYEGEPLNAILRERRLSVGEVVAITKQIAQGLAAAHRNKIVHRDIKPSNIIITRDRVVKIVDFGLARFSGAEHLTEAGSTVGTAAYMSPEQACGDELDHRTDIWSLGVVLYEMLTGVLPFRGDNPHSLLYNVVHRPLEPRVPVPEPLVPIVRKALAKERDARYGRAEDLIADLDRIDAGQTFELPTGTIVETIALPRPRRLPRLRWITGALAVLLMAVAALIPGVRSYVAQRAQFAAANAPKHIVVLPLRTFGNDPDTAAVSEGLTEVLTGRLTNLEQSAPSLWVIPASEVRRRKVATEDDARTQFGAALAISGIVQKIGAGFQLTLNLVDANTIRVLASRIVRSPAGDLAALEDEAVKDIGELLAVHVGPDANRGTNASQIAPQAYEAYLKARGLLRRPDKPDNVEEAMRSLNDAVEKDPRFALGYSGLAEAAWAKWVVTHDTKWLDAVAAHAKKALALDAQIAPPHIWLAQAYEATENRELAIAELQQALALDPRNVDATRAIGRMWERMGRVKDAEAKFTEAIELHPDYWQGHQDYALFLEHQGRIADSEREYRKALELAPDNATVYSNLGALLVRFNRLEEARQLFEKSISLSPSYFATANLALVLDKQGHVPEAARSYEQALKLNDKDYRVWAYLAWEYERLKDPKARPTLEHARAMAEKLREREPESPVLLSDLAYYYAKLGRREDAMDLARQATAAAPADTKVLRRSALAFELAGARAEALKTIGAALASGAKPDTFTSDSELQKLVADRRFAEIVSSAKKSGTSSPKSH